MSTVNLTNEEYDMRKRFLEDLKLLSKTEHAKILEILQKHKADFSENSNGVFFDVSKITAETFHDIQTYMEFCKIVRQDQARRDEYERQAQDMLR